MNLNRFLSSLPNDIFPYAVFTASMVLPVMMAPKDQLLCSVSTVVLCQLTLVAFCIGLDLAGQKFGNSSPLTRFLDQPQSSSFKKFVFPTSANAICGFAAPAA